MTLFDKYGGRVFWGDVADLFYERLLKDQQIVAYFTGCDVLRMKALNSFLLESTLGFSNPRFLAGVRSAHERLKVQRSDFRRYLSVLLQVCREQGVEEEDLEEIAELLLVFEPDIVG